MPWIDTNGFATYYEQQGEGTPLLLIPGRGLDRSSWAPQVACYAQHFRTITYDPRGVGKTRAPEGDFDVEQMADDAAVLLRALGIAEAHVAGFSLGGMAAIHMATQGKAKLLSLGLHSTVHRAYAHLRLRQRLSLRILQLDDAELWAAFSAYTAFGAEFTNAHPDIVEEEIERRARRWAAFSEADKEGTRAQIRAAMTHDDPELLQRIDVPSLVTVGSSDEVTRPEYAQEIAATIANARFVVFPGGPHRTSTFMAEEFNRVTLDFLLGVESRRRSKPAMSA